MVSILSLWLPIVLSAVLVFLASSVIHMAVRYHNSDFGKMPNEATALAGIRDAKVTPGEYAFPCPADMKDMGTPEMGEKYKQGPVGFVTVVPNGTPGMGASLVQWFIYSLVLAVVTAYVTSRTVEAGAEYLSIFRVAGVVSFLAYGGAQAQSSIWMKRKWSTTFKYLVDSFIYGMLTAGAFAGFWPE